MQSSFALSGTKQVLSRRAGWSPRATRSTSSSSPTTGSPRSSRTSRPGYIDATVSQPADLYAKYGLFYVKAAIAGKTFQPGPTDHDSTIIQVRDGVLEDQLSAPLVTADGATFGPVASVKVDDQSLG